MAGGRPKGSKSAAYIHISRHLFVIEQACGKPYEVLYAELLKDSMDKYYDGSDTYTFPTMMAKLFPRLTEAVPQQVQLEQTPAAEMSDEELRARAAEIVSKLQETTH